MLVNNFPDRTITIENREYLYFGGTAYLGLATHTEFQQVLFQSIKKWGTFYGSSRSSNIKLSVYNQFEDFFAKQIGAEASLTVSSGTLAGKLVIDFLATQNQIFFHYPKTHPAILAKHSLPLIVNDKLHPRLLDDIKEEIVITADAILGLEVQPTSFEFLEHIPSHKKITLIIDESHSLGVIGKQGKGVFNSLQYKSIQRKIMISSLGKALGLSGGIIAADNEFINVLKEESIFVSSSAANPAYLETYINTQSIYKEQQLRLQHNLGYLSAQLKSNKNIKFHKNYPVIYCEDDAIYEELFKEGVVITNFKYPTYKKLMSRIVITANHIESDLKTLIQVLNKEKKNLIKESNEL